MKSFCTHFAPLQSYSDGWFTTSALSHSFSSSLFIHFRFVCHWSLICVCFVCCTSFFHVFVVRIVLVIERPCPESWKPEIYIYIYIYIYPVSKSLPRRAERHPMPLYGSTKPHSSTPPTAMQGECINDPRGIRRPPDGINVFQA